MLSARQKISLRPKAAGKQLSLFGDEFLEVNNYRYTCYITSLKLSAADIWRLYPGCANCENRIKELKYYYALDKMNQICFDGTEAALMLMTIAYNFLSLFKQVIIGGDVRNRLKTLRHKILAIPAIIERNEDKTIVNLALHIMRRSCIAKMCDRIDQMNIMTG
ncbi:MAG: transposase [Paludibacter sp.]|nr:transposase [Paludibacter sp.]